MQVTYTKHYLQVLVSQALKGIWAHREHALKQWDESEKGAKD